MNNSPTQTKVARGLIGRVAIQCVEPVSGKTGTFLFSGQNHRELGTAQSPVLADCVALFQWCRANGWIPCGPDYLYEPEISAKMGKL